MPTIFKWLLWSSVPSILLTIILAVNWQSLFYDLEAETKTQTEHYYEQNAPSFISDISDKIGEYTQSDARGEDAPNQPLPCRQYQGKVVSVTDGDTIIALDDKKVQHKIRFRGIDAPEKAQDFGDEATRNLIRLLAEKKINIETCETDRFYPEREIALVSTLDGASINELQVESGFAHYYKDFSANLAPEERKSLAAAESRAKRRRLGLWTNPNPMLPSNFRRATK